MYNNNLQNSKEIKSDGYIRLTAENNGITVCNVFPKRNDPARVENLKRCAAKMVFEEATKGKE